MLSVYNLFVRPDSIFPYSMGLIISFNPFQFFQSPPGSNQPEEFGYTYNLNQGSLNDAFILKNRFCF